MLDSISAMERLTGLHAPRGVGPAHAVGAKLLRSESSRSRFPAPAPRTPRALSGVATVHCRPAPGCLHCTPARVAPARLHSGSRPTRPLSLAAQASHDTATTVGNHLVVPPPYNLDALVPYGISEQTLRSHVDHYEGLLEELNRQLDDDDALKRLPLEDLVKTAYNNGNPLPCFNLAAETWNHQFFWTSLNPGSGGDRSPPSGELEEILERDFGGLEGFKRQFRNVALSSFGSCWVWLSARVETLVPEEWLRDLPAHNPYRLTVARLRIEKTSNALNPIAFDHIPLLCLDLWEHAYIGDFKMEKEKYVDIFLNKLASWDTVVARMETAKAYVNFKEMPTPEKSLFKPGFIGDFRLSDAPITQEKAMSILGKKSNDESIND